MNKKLLVLAVLFSVIISFSSCTTDNDEDNEVSQEWKTYNEKQVREAAASGKYAERESLSGNGRVYWKSIDDFVTESLPGTITEDRTPLFTDSVTIRYEGWSYRLDGTKYTFDSTEGDKNGIEYKSRANKFIDGFTTMLQYMKIDDQVEVCIPYLLGYGASGSYTSSGVQTIPGYTTLWFKIKLTNIYDDGKKKWIKR